MSDDLSKLHRMKRVIMDEDPTDCSPIPDIRNRGASQASVQLADNEATLDKLRVMQSPTTEPTVPDGKPLNTDEILAHQKQEIEELRSAIGVMSSEIRRLNSALLQTPTPTTAPPAQTAGTVNRILVVLNGSQKLKYPLFKASMTIGRSPDNDIQIATEYVSRVHARITSSEAGAVIEDLNSQNGVVVNSHKVGRQQLRNGDLVALGKMQFKFIDLMETGSGEGQA